MQHVQTNLCHCLLIAFPFGNVDETHMGTAGTSTHKQLKLMFMLLFLREFLGIQCTIPTTVAATRTTNVKAMAATNPRRVLGKAEQQAPS